MQQTVVGVLALVGGVLALLAGVGVLRFRDVYERMHATTKMTSLALLSCCLAAVLALERAEARIVLAAVFTLITAPTAAQVIGRAAYRREGIAFRLPGGDALAAALDADLTDAGSNDEPQRDAAPGHGDSGDPAPKR
jgi:multicomponent Na+:H+ antiporter subunit G